MDEINELLTRGVANIIPSKELLEKELQAGKKLNIYLGIDPTATKIHLGHAVVLRKLRDFTLLGHNVTFLVGDFTALIGDTSDKESERPQLKQEEVIANLETYKSQAEKVLDFSNVTIKYNSEWLSKLNFTDIVKLTQHFSLGDFISRELIKKRLSSGGKIGLHEVLYPAMQGYDSYHLDTDIQLGGTDQTFNMQAGRTLQKDLRSKESFVLTMNFLTGTDGRKMSKTWGNAIWLDDNPNDMYGKVMSIKDDLIIEYFTLATDWAMNEIEAFSSTLNEKAMDTKKILAKTIVSSLHGEEKGELAQENFSSVVQEKNIPDNIPVGVFLNGATVAGSAVANNLVDSNSEWKRLVSQGAVSVNGTRIENPFMKNDELEEGGILKIGNRIYAKIEKT